MLLKAGDLLHDRYDILRPITAGGMGSVYEAHDKNLDGPCAVKEMHETRDAWVHRRFKEEASLLSRLNHPDIPRVRDFFLEDNIGYIVMDFVQGSNLHQEITQLRRAGANTTGAKKGYDSAQATEVGLAVLGVLEYLHSLTPTVLHRDIKPSNIIRDGTTGKIKLVDFGLARPLVDTTQTCAGTINFAAPEQLMGQADERSDLYGVGATLFFLVSGQPPPIGISKPILMLVPDLDTRLAQVIDRVLDQDPENRYPSATAMREALATPKVILPPKPEPNRAIAPVALVGIFIAAVFSVQWYAHRSQASRTPSATPTVRASTADLPDTPALSEVKAQTTLSVRTKVAPANLDQAYASMLTPVLRYATSRSLKPVHSFVRYHLYEPPKPIDLEVGIITREAIPGDAVVKSGTLPAAKVARLVHRGEYTALAQRFMELLAWTKERHLKVRAGAWAVYKVTGGDDPNPDNWVTEVYWPLADSSPR